MKSMESNMKKELKKLEESLTQISKFQMDEPDSEGEMAKSQMLKTMKYAVEIMNMIDDTTELPAWVQSKLTKISDYIGAVKHYMDSKTVRHVVTNMMENDNMKLKDMISKPINEMVSFDELVSKKYGSVHGNAQHFSRIDGKEYTWNYVEVRNGKYSVSNTPTDTIAVSRMAGKNLKVAKIVKEGLDPDIAKHMVGIHKGFIKVEGDGTMIYDSPTSAKKAADYLNSKKVAASSDGKYLYIESTVNEGLDSDIAKHMIGIYKGFVKVEGDGTMIYDSPTNAKKAANYLDSKDIAVSTDGKYLYIESAVNEAPDDNPSFKKVGNEYFVDTRFVQLSRNFGTLRHLWAGNFVVETPKGEVNFFRVGKSFPNFVGRTHEASGSKEAVDSLINGMTKKYGLKSESNNFQRMKELANIKSNSKIVDENVSESDIKMLDKLGDKLAKMEERGKENTPEYKKLEKEYKALEKKVGM